MTTVGRVALYLVFALVAYATVTGALAGRRRDRRLTRSARNAFLAAFGCTLVAVATLEYGLVEHDFSLAVVAEHTSRALPLRYTLSALWASQEGSLLLWLTVLTGAASIALHQNRHRNRELVPWVAAVLGGIGIFFAGMAAFVS
jgi:cytochrome c-type biogenesis protein CcmF